jgi:hypothetical protein
VWPSDFSLDFTQSEKSPRSAVGGEGLIQFLKIYLNTRAVEIAGIFINADI